MTKDENKAITAIAYNHINLPTTVTINGQNILYIYDATGVKIQKTVSGTTTDYDGNYIYKKVGTGPNELQFYNTAEGYATPVNASSYGSGFKYVYQYKDHLGNIRLSYSDSDGNGSIAQSEIIEEKNYYPFGLTHKGYNDVTNPGGNSVANRWGYNGKELQDEDVNGKSLDWYDFGARNYDPALGRWMNLDPLAEKTLDPFGYVWNNPIIHIDPDGRSGQTTIVGKGEKEGTYVVKDWIDDGKTDVTLEDGTKIGNSLTTHSFVDDNNKAVEGAVIDMNSSEGQDFIDNEIIKDKPFIVKYMANGTGGENYDFKSRGMEDALAEGKSEIQHNYRGSVASNGEIGSARDFGNIGAGIVAGRFGLKWGASRIGFDTLQTLQNSSIEVVDTPMGPSPILHIDFQKESTTTQKAQKLGWDIGIKLNKSDGKIKF